MTHDACTADCTHGKLADPDELLMAAGEHQVRGNQWRAVYESGSASPDAAAIVLLDDPHASIVALKDEFGPAFHRLNQHRECGNHPVLGHGQRARVHAQLAPEAMACVMQHAALANNRLHGQLRSLE